MSQFPPSDSGSPPRSPLFWMRVLSWGLLVVSAVFLVWVVTKSAQQLTDKPAGPVSLRQELKPEDIWKEPVADFTLIDQDGNTVTKQDLLGRPWAVCFVFSRCAGHCLNISQGMQEIQKSLGDSEVRLVSLSVDPTYDTPAVLKNYADNFGADPQKWWHLTGDQQQIYDLVKKSFLLPVQENTGADRRKGFEVDHSPHILHVNAAGRVVGKYNGLDRKERIQLVAALKAEAKSLSAAEKKAEPPRLSGVGTFELTERSGRKITQDDLLGKPWAVCFVFTRCAGPCLGITANMAQLQEQVAGADVRLVSISVDPDYDTPAVLRNYADNFGADPEKWLFLTGEKDYVYSLLRSRFRQLVAENEGPDRQKGFEVFHTTDVLHIDAEGNIVKRYNGSNDGEMLELAFALREEAEHLAFRKPRPAVAEKP